MCRWFFHWARQWGEILLLFATEVFVLAGVETEKEGARESLSKIKKVCVRESERVSESDWGRKCGWERMIERVCERQSEWERVCVRERVSSMTFQLFSRVNAGFSHTHTSVFLLWLLLLFEWPPLFIPSYLLFPFVIFPLAFHPVEIWKVSDRIEK